MSMHISERPLRNWTICVYIRDQGPEKPLSLNFSNFLVHFWWFTSIPFFQLFVSLRPGVHICVHAENIVYIHPKLKITVNPMFLRQKKKEYMKKNFFYWHINVAGLKRLQYIRYICLFFFCSVRFKNYPQILF